MEFDVHPFGILACRALEYARITSRFVSSMRASFILVSHFTRGFWRHFCDSRTQYVFADAGCGESGNQSGARNACDGHMRYVWTTMPILSIKHVTTYRYRQPVAFGEHRIMLRPRDDEDQRLLQSALEIRPKPRELAWGRDRLGNHVAIAHFDDRSDELRVVSTICLEHTPNGFYEGDIKDYARIYPFSYIAEDWSRLRGFILPLSLEPELRRWSDQFFRNGSADTHALLVDMTQTIRRTFRHVARHEKGIQDPIRTIALGTGSCRDLAMLMIAALRSRGIAARFVSGYVHLAEEKHEDEHQITGGNTHAWVQAYVPGPGWVDFDPSAGVVGNQNLIRVAVVEHPREAIPLQGTWYGSASDHLAMQVAVRVKAALKTELSCDPILN
jgi:transglutaminase-like putative cysteine protease